MTKSELIERLAARHPQFMLKDVELAVKLVLDQISDALAKLDRVEIRGFAVFSLHRRPARLGRNPRPAPLCRFREERAALQARQGDARAGERVGQALDAFVRSA